MTTARSLVFTEESIIFGVDLGEVDDNDTNGFAGAGVTMMGLR